MLSKLAETIWLKIAGAPAEWFEENTSLLARATLAIYRKDGKENARMFINLCRMAIVVNVA